MCLVDSKYSYRAEGPPGIPGRTSKKSIFFSNRFFIGFWMVFGSLLVSILDDFLCFLHHFFEYEICIDFASILERILISFSMVVWWISHSRIHLARSLAKLVFEQQYGVLRSKSRFYPFRKHNFSWFSWSFSIPVLALTFYAPRLPADPLARSECIRSFVFSLRALQAPCLGTTLGGTPPPEPHPQGPPTHPQDPHPPTPPHPPLVRVEVYSKWMFIPSGWLFRVQNAIPKWLKNWVTYGVRLQLKIRVQQTRAWLFQVDGYSECMAIPWGPTSTQNSNPTNKDALKLSQCRKHLLLRWVIVPSPVTTRRRL